MPFTDWLGGKAVVPGMIEDGLNYPLDSTDRLDINGPIDLTINHNWLIRLQPHENACLKLFGAQEQFKEVDLSINRANISNSKYNQEAERASVFELRHPGGKLQSMESLKFSGKRILGNSLYPFGYMGLVLSKSSGKIQKTLWASNDN